MRLPSVRGILPAAGRRITGFVSSLKPRVKVVATADRPTRLRPRRLYVTVQADRPAFGFMLCPCGCGETLHLRFFGTRHPRWHVARLSGPATVEPSVWRTSGCRSHFILRDGQIHWCD